MQRNNSDQIEFFLQCMFDGVPYILGKTIISEITAKAKLKEGNWQRIDKRTGPHQRLKSYMIKEIN